MGAIMRIKPVLAFLGAAAFSTCALAEPSLPGSVSADGNSVIVQGTASPVMRLTLADAEDANGSFQLKDGRVLTLSNQNHRMYMELGGKREELLPVSRTRFVARTSGAELAVDTLRFPETVTLTEMKR
jgi:hypothetical protein